MQFEDAEILKRKLIKSACEGWDEGTDIEWSREWITFDLTAYVEELIEKIQRNNLPVDSALEEAFIFGFSSNKKEAAGSIRGNDVTH